MRNVPRTLAPTLLLLASALFARDANAGAQVKGRISGQEKLSPDVYVEAAKDPHRYSWRDVSPSVQPAFRMLSANPSREICIAAFTSGQQNPHEAVLVKVTGGRTVPVTIVVSPGTRLAFKNVDPFPHRLFQVGDQKWVATPTSGGGIREWQATGPGRYEFRDELFPSVRTYVVVDPQLFDFVYPDHDGGFLFTSLPQGDYVIKAFFGGHQVGHDVSGVHVGNKEQPVEIKEPILVGGDAK